MDSTQAQLSELSRYQATFGYWNDNIIIQRVAGKELNLGNDDNVTASFWLQVSKEKESGWWFLDVYHNVLTNRKAKYRLDLLSIRLSMEIEVPQGYLKFGIGAITSGNFGGEFIQNAYHELTDVKSLKLPYKNYGKVGPIAYLKCTPLIWNSPRVRFNAYGSNSFRGDVGPSNYRVGFELSLNMRPAKKSWLYNFQAGGGYIHYYLQGKYLSPLFDNGFTIGAMASAGISKKMNASVWITNNQYGKHQPHYGISLTFGWNGSRMCDLSDVSFP